MVLGLLAALATAPAAAAPWVAELPVLWPALQACLGGDRLAFADGAWRIGTSQWGVRLRQGGRTTYCIARAEDGAVQQRLPLPAAPPPEPGATAFFLERRCAEARRVSAADGTVIGWLAPARC